MLNSAILMITILLTLLFFMVGGIIGWLTNQYLVQNKPPYLHPEFFDTNGNILPDEIISVHFEGNIDDYYNDEDDSEEEDCQ
jgi:hypothetical protein